MAAYYNEFDPKTAAWLRELIKRNLIAPGDVDERSIKEVQPDDLRGYTQVHLFAGIGGWSYALRLASWPDDAPVWSGSCPCQPFSPAGKRKGINDERHLWPEMRRLVAERRPAICFGEQVAGKDGRQWLTGVRADLETLGYAVGAADLCAASVGAPIIRQRLFWVSCAAGSRSAETAAANEESEGGRSESGRTYRPDSRRLSAWNESGDSENDVIVCADGRRRRTQSELYPLAARIPGVVAFMRGYGNSIVPQVAAEFIQAYREARGG